MTILNSEKRIRIFRVLSVILTVVSVLLFFFDRTMAVWSLVTGLLFLLCYCSWSPRLNRQWLLCLPCLPMLFYDADRIYLFLKAGLSNRYNVMYTLEVLLLAVTYAFAAVLIMMSFKVRWLRLTSLILCCVCILLGIWDIFDGVWVVMNNPSTDHVKRFIFYYIPDICFWILPFTMLGSVCLHKKL